jgi:hypothetical protein
VAVLDIAKASAFGQVQLHQFFWARRPRRHCSPTLP